MINDVNSQADFADALRTHYEADSDHARVLEALAHDLRKGKPRKRTLKAADKYLAGHADEHSTVFKTVTRLVGMLRPPHA